MDTRIASCIHINFRFFPLKTGQEYLACTETVGFSYLVLLFPPLFPIACALQHIFTSYKDCQTWLCCSHMNVRLNLSPMGKMLEVEMNIRITLCVLMNFRSFSDFKSAQHAPSYSPSLILHFVPLVLPLLPMAFGLEHVFASYKDCYTWLCRSHMNVRFNLSSMGEGGIGDGHDYILCSYWGSWHAPSLCLLTNNFALLFPLLFIASALKHVSTAFEAKAGHVAHT